jgi:hypothetical protein
MKLRVMSAICVVLLFFCATGARSQLVQGITPAFQGDVVSAAVSRVASSRGGRPPQAPRWREPAAALVADRLHCTPPCTQNVSVSLDPASAQLTFWSDVLLPDSCTSPDSGACTPLQWLAVALRDVYEVDAAGRRVAQVRCAGRHVGIPPRGKG